MTPCYDGCVLYRGGWLWIGKRERKPYRINGNEGKAHLADW